MMKNKHFSIAEKKMMSKLSSNFCIYMMFCFPFQTREEKTCQDRQNEISDFKIGVFFRNFHTQNSISTQILLPFHSFSLVCLYTVETSSVIQLQNIWCVCSLHCLGNKNTHCMVIKCKTEKMVLQMGR